MTDWRPHARALADTLGARGDLRDPRWHLAVAETARHVLVPEAWRQAADLSWKRIDTGDPAAFDLVYSPTTLVTKVHDGRAVSSSTKPDLVVRMLERLDVADGADVLEIGTGTGYNAALLTHRLGDEHVTSVDVDTELVDSARARLHQLGRHPTLVAADGALGHLDRAPYDRIIATCSIPLIPTAWREQLVEGGLLLATVAPGVHAGTLAVLRHEGDTLYGRFVDRAVSFMPLRHSLDRDVLPEISLAPPHGSRPTSVPPEPWRSCPVAWLWTVLDLPGPAISYVLDDTADLAAPLATRIAVPDGSWAELPFGEARGNAHVGGPTAVLDVLEHHVTRWRQAGSPAWNRIGLTVTPDAQTLWLDESPSAMLR